MMTNQNMRGGGVMQAPGAVAALQLTPAMDVNKMAGTEEEQRQRDLAQLAAMAQQRARGRQQAMSPVPAPAVPAGLEAVLSKLLNKGV